MKSIEKPAGWIVRHQREKRNWRLRNVTGLHPTDPNWETGTYCKCHKKLRTSSEVKNSIIFDAIWIKGEKYPFVRSTFKIKSIKDEILEFDSYYFADDEPLKITPYIISGMKPRLYRTNPGKKLNKKDTKTLFDKIKKSYTKYKKGEKPKSIPTDEWKLMVVAAKKNMQKHHTCSFDSKSFIPIQSINAYL